MARTHDWSRLRGIAKAGRFPTNDPEVHGVRLIVAWNYATSPWILRTDEEHAKCVKYARAILKRLVTWHVPMRENENGLRLYGRGE